MASDSADLPAEKPASLYIETHGEGVRLRCSCGWVWVFEFDQNPILFGQVGYQATQHVNAVHRSNLW